MESIAVVRLTTVSLAQVFELCSSMVCSKYVGMLWSVRDTGQQFWRRLCLQIPRVLIGAVAMCQLGVEPRIYFFNTRGSSALSDTATGRERQIEGVGGSDQSRD
jgi:hypothetical protein